MTPSTATRGAKVGDWLRVPHDGAANLTDIADFFLWSECGAYHHAADLHCWVTTRELADSGRVWTEPYEVADLTAQAEAAGLLVRGARPELWHHGALTRMAYPGGETNHRASLRRGGDGERGPTTGGDGYLYAWSATDAGAAWARSQLRALGREPSGLWDRLALRREQWRALCRREGIAPGERRVGY